MTSIIDEIVQDVEQLDEENFQDLYDDIVIQNWDFFRTITFSGLTDCELDDVSIAKFFLLLNNKDKKYAYYTYSNLRDSVISFSFLMEHINEKLHTFDPPEEVIEYINLICSVIREFGQKGLADLEEDRVYKFKIQRTLDYLKREIKRFNNFINDLSAEYQELEKSTSNTSNSYLQLKRSSYKANSFLSKYGIQITIIGIFIFELTSIAEMDGTWEHELLKICVGICYFKKQEVLGDLASYLSDLSFRIFCFILKIYIGTDFRNSEQIISSQGLTKSLQMIQQFFIIYLNNFVKELFVSVCAIQNAILSFSEKELLIVYSVIENKSFEEFYSSSLNNFSRMININYSSLDEFIENTILTVGPIYRNIFHKFAESFAIAQGVVFNDPLIENESKLIQAFNMKNFSEEEYDELNEFLQNSIFNFGTSDDVIEFTIPSLIANEVINTVLSSDKSKNDFINFYKETTSEYDTFFNRSIVIEKLYNYITGDYLENDFTQEFRILTSVWYLSVMILWTISNPL